MITFLLVACAAAFFLWPAAKKNESITVVPGWPPIQMEPAAPAEADPPAPAARDAIDSLLEVRDRLAATEALDEDSAKAVDVLWLDLLHGSQKK